jgi:hypothetical protein
MAGRRLAGHQGSAGDGGETVKKTALLLALALCATDLVLVQQSSAQQSSAPLGARLKLHWKGATVYVREGSSEHELAIRDHFHAVILEKVILQSAKEAGGFIYLLLDVTGPSKVPADSHQCGGGTESDLIWLKLDKDWKVQEAKDFRYDSCWSTISADDPPKWEGDTLKVSVFSVASGGNGVNQVATYTYKHPEEGIKVTEAPAGK